MNMNNTDHIEDLLKLKDLYQKGVITKEELEAEKLKLLGQEQGGHTSIASNKSSEKAIVSDAKPQAKNGIKWISIIGVVLVLILSAVLILSVLHKKHQAAFYSAPTGTENGYGYVDLGLSVRWATCNIGAQTPGEDGLFFQWSKTTPVKDFVTFKDYVDHAKQQNGEKPLDIEALNSEYGTTINMKYPYEELNSFAPKYTGSDAIEELELEDDAAHATMGGKWRIPRKEDYIELFRNCDDTSVEYDGKRYVIFTSRINGNSIAFLECLHLTTASVSSEAYGTYSFYFFPYYDWQYHWYNVKLGTPLNIPQCVRPVCDK